MSGTDILYAAGEGIATITLNRPERMNALTHALETEMHRLFDEADADRAVKVIILTGNGAAFCAGYDQGQTGKSGTRHSDPKGKSHAEFIEYWHRQDGARVGQWAHVAAGQADHRGGQRLGHGRRLLVPARRRHHDRVRQGGVRPAGDPPHLNSSFLFAALCGWKAANRWALTGDHFDAQEALRIGMVNEVGPHDQLMEATHALAKRLTNVPEPSLRLNKAITMLGIQASGLYSGLLLEGALGALAHSSHNEYREALFEKQRGEGLKAYLEMRDGPFQPEPMGPRSAKGRAARERQKKAEGKNGDKGKKK